MEFGKHIKLKIDIFIIPLIMLVLLYDCFRQYLMTFIFISSHELGHILVALLLGAKFNSLRILPIGLNAIIDNQRCDKNSRILIYLAGPFVNIIMAAVCFVLKGFHLSTLINISLALFNLLPIQPMDGGKIALEILSVRLGLFKANKQLETVSIIVSIIIILFGLLVFIKNKYNISFVLIGIYIISCLKANKRETTFMNIKNLLFRRARIIKKGIYPVREIVVMKNMSIANVIKAMDYADMFHLVSILDDNLRVIRVMTEQEILDAGIENGADVTFDKLLTTYRN